MKLKILSSILVIGLFVYSFIRLFLPVMADQTISVTGTVPPQASDFQVAVTSDTASSVSQNKDITYTITYGSHLLYAGQLIVEAQWYQGTIAGSPAPSVDVATYKPGSSSTAYNNTSAVIDSVNQKIDWTISSFPSQTTGQSVSFTLTTTANYTGASTVSFPVKVRLISPNFTTADQTQSQTYLYDATQVTPTPTPTSAPAATPTPGTTVTPTSTPTPIPVKPLTITALSLKSISDASIDLFVETSAPSNLTVLYGTSPINLTNSISKSGFHSLYDVLLDNLIVDTKYYVQVKATDGNGNSATSDIFVFKTAQLGQIPQVDPTTVTFVASNIVLYIPKQNTSGSNAPISHPIITVPQNVTYNFRFQVNKPQAIKRVQVVIRNKFVLGITSADATDPNTTITDLIETQNGVYEGQLKAPPLPGSYEEFARVSDIYGNISEQKLADVNVSQPFRVFNKDTQQPIEAAQVLFYYQNYRTHVFLPLPPQLFPIKNPSYTDIAGQIILPLPEGTYKASITALGYAQKIVTFTIGPNPGEDYPAVLLTAQPFNLFTIGKYYLNILQDTLATTKAFIQDVSYSTRFFDLNAVIATAFLVFLTLLSFSSRIHIPLRYLFTYFLNFSKISAVQRKLGNAVKGRIFDEETGSGIPGADVYLIDSKKGDILNHTTSNKQGDFLFNLLPSEGYDIEIMAKDFEPTVFHESEIHAVELGGYLLSIKKRESAPSLFERLKLWIRKLLSVLFETLLILSFVNEIAIGYALGWDKTILFMIFSAVNLFLWILHLTHLRAEKNVF